MIVSEDPLTILYTNAAEREAHKAKIARAEEAFGPINKRVNDMLKVFTAAVLTQTDDYSPENKLLHNLIPKIAAIRMNISVGWFNSAFTAACACEQAYGDRVGIEAQNREIFEGLDLPHLPSSLFVEMRGALESFVTKTP